MRYQSLTPALACLTAVLAGSASAQNTRPTSTFRHSLSVTTGLTFTDRLDITASPRPFAGVGTAAGLSYRFEPGRWALGIEATGTQASYSPRDNLAGSESALAGGVGISVERQAMAGASTTLLLGLNLDTRAELLQHRYADAVSTLSSFTSGFAMLGPSATLRRKLGGGEFSATAVVPVVGLAHQPYANTRQEREPVTIRTVGFSALRGESLGLRYESSAAARMGVVAQYRLRTFDYSGGWRARSLTNSTAIGVVARFGSKAR